MIPVSGIRHTNIIWASIEYDALENCTIAIDETGVYVNSVIVGLYGQDIYRITWRLTTNSKWIPLSFKLNITTGQQTITEHFESDGRGNWTRNSAPAEEFAGCLYVDIALTPFTNTLPINNLEMSPGDTKVIRVVYFDILSGEVRALSQQYTRLSETQYRYQNIPNDFEAIITVDEQGLVADYPQLFKRLRKNDY